MGRSDDNKDRKASGRGEGFKKKSFARGNAPIKRKSEGDKKPSDPNVIRLNKYVANSGVCSRRDADIYIASGNVTVNGKPVTEMGYKVKLTDVVKFDGRLLSPEKKEYVLLNKPKDFVTTTTDSRGRRSAMQLVLNASKSKISPIGRLDKDDTGLILFTNDGEMAKRLARPQNGLRKIYHVVLDKNLKFEDLKAIEEGVTIDESVIRVAEISYIDNAPKREVGIEIHSTRNKAVQRIFEHLGYEVEKLDRVVYAGLTKKDLPRGHWRYLTEQEVINLGMIK
ncbi:pseudouridine synthase [Sediminicola sp. 1XM1-17]|uniref:pseudouridine synthase n=1 Tax=Sediminicola sp. 1XM1-17 TaxID=3127702 RepID=UPI00307860E7